MLSTEVLSIQQFNASSAPANVLHVSDAPRFLGHFLQDSKMQLYARRQLAHAFYWESMRREKEKGVESARAAICVC
jgi:hypothetical protein